MGLLGRPRWHFHRRGGAAAGRYAHRPQAPLGEPGGLSRRRRPGHPRPARPESGRGAAVRPGRCGEDGHHGRDQCAAGAQGRTHLVADHQWLPRRVADRLPGAAEDLRQAHHQARDAVRAGVRGRRAGAGGRHRRTAARSCSRARRARARAGRRHQRGGDPVHARLPLSRAREAGRSPCPRDGLSPGLSQPRGLAAHQAGRPRRHHGGGCISVADSEALRRDSGR